MHINTLNNLILSLSERVHESVTQSNGDQSTSAAATLAILASHPGLSIKGIAEHLGLSHSATVRLIDRLEKDWLVRRSRKRGREVRIELTATGQRAARRLNTARQQAMADLLEGVSEEGHRNLRSGLSELLAANAGRDTMPTRWCRLCDKDGCDASVCPCRA